MYTFATVDKHGTVTRVVQTTDSWIAPEKQITVYYVNADGLVEFDGSAHSMSAAWLSDCIGRWTADGGTITGWSN